MEQEIEALSQRLQQEPNWDRGLDNLDRDLIRLSLRATQLSTYAFAHEDDPSETWTRAAWRNFVVQFVQFLTELDRTGLSEIMGRLTPEYLADFSFSNAREFREFEENLEDVPVLEMPREGWNRFWGIADVAVPRFLEVMRVNQPFMFRPLFSETHQKFEASVLNFEHLSPFKWRKAVAAGTGFLLAIADTAVIARPLELDSLRWSRDWV